MTPFAKTCMFVPIDGKIEHTGSFFSDTWNDTMRHKCLEWLLKHGCDTLTFWLANDDKRCPVNFFEDHYCGKLNMAKAYSVLQWCNYVRMMGGKVVPILWCDSVEPGGQVVQHDLHPTFARLVVSSLFAYADAFILGIETSEWMSLQEKINLISICKAYQPCQQPDRSDQKWVGIHEQWNFSDALPGNTDFLAYEHSWHPDQGDKHSPQEVVSEVSKAHAKSGLNIWALEYNTNANGNAIRAQSQALIGIQGCVGVGGPVI